MGPGPTGRFRTHAVRLRQSEAGENPKCGENSAAHAQGQGSAPYIKDGAAQEALGVPWSREFGTSGKYPKISSPGDPESNCWRHTFGTRCVESGMDRHTLAKLMGHSSPRISERYYIHVTEPHISAAFECFISYQAKWLGTNQGASLQ